MENCEIKYTLWSQIKCKFLKQLSQNLQTSLPFHKLANLNEFELLKYVSVIKDKICYSPLVTTRTTPTNKCTNLIHDNLNLYHLNASFVNEILRKIMRKEFNSFNFNHHIHTLTINLSHLCDLFSYFAYFYLYLPYYLKIRKVIFSVFIPKNLLSDLYTFIIFDYFILNDMIDQVKIVFDIMLVEYSFSLFDLIKLKTNLRKLTISISNLQINIKTLNNILINTPLLEKFKINNSYRIIIDNKLDFKEFLFNLKNLNFIENFQISGAFQHIGQSNPLLKILDQEYLSYILFDLLINKNFKKFGISDIHNLVKEDDLNIKRNSENNLNKYSNYLDLKLFINFENLIKFNFINFNSLNKLDIGLLDYNSVINLIVKLENISLKELTFRVDNNFDKSIEKIEDLEKIFLFLNNKKYKIKKFNLLNYNNKNEEILIHIIDNYLIKDTFVESFNISPYHNICDNSNYTKNSNYNKTQNIFIYNKLDLNEMIKILFVLKKLKIRQKYIIETISKFCQKKINKEIIIENSNNIILLIKK